MIVTGLLYTLMWAKMLQGTVLMKPYHNLLDKPGFVEHKKLWAYQLTIINLCLQ